jgi:hypothetical protein
MADLEKLGGELISLANNRGGPDNITVVVAKFEGPGLPLPEVDPSYVVLDTEDGAAPPTPPETPAAPPPVVVERTGSPAGMALLVIGVLIVLLAVFLAVI